eukprot:GHVQ01041310.1.p1 GENE.GHVQ01041310.1~~GHVQ01041310.1.p1  ORF type:complete len:1187 (-),score=250.78 GHVQ01041310.1:117-3173(-)
MDKPKCPSSDPSSSSSPTFPDAPVSVSCSTPTPPSTCVSDTALTPPPPVSAAPLGGSDHAVSDSRTSSSSSSSSNSSNSSAVLNRDDRMDKYYLTTAINYTNGPPHMGHAYEAVTSDVLSRYHRTAGRDVFFLTGTDEHGQKIYSTAEKAGKSAAELCDMYAKGFCDLNERLCISNDFFVRTTSVKHRETCQWLWQKAVSSGDIYLDKYVGWYNEREETFVSETEAKLTSYKDPETNKPLTKMEEESYFFRMSRYQTRLMDYIKENPNFILPLFRRNEIWSRLQEPLCDLSCSRTTFTWGVPVPNDPAHVMYVWFDALTNYLTGIGYPNDVTTSHYWPPQVQIIGKDIMWFHCVIWPCMLMSADLPLPKSVFAHGFVTAADSRKMSKSLGNALNPKTLLDEFSSDTLRYFMIKEARFGADLKFDVDSLIESHNAELCDTLGNLTHRATSLCKKYCDSVVPDVCIPNISQPPFCLSSLIQDTDNFYRNLCLLEPLELVMSACRDTNKYVTDLAPWSKTLDNLHRHKIIRALLDSVYILAHFLSPIIPSAASKMFQKLGQPPLQSVFALSDKFENLKPGSVVTVGDVLFDKLKPRCVGEKAVLDQEDGGAAAGGTTQPKAEGPGGGGGKGKIIGGGGEGKVKMDGKVKGREGGGERGGSSGPVVIIESELRQCELNAEERYHRAMLVGDSCVEKEELVELFKVKAHPICYDGFEPSGRMHIAQGVLKAINVNRLTSAGCVFVFWVADWFALLNNKMGGDLHKIKKVGEYFIEVWKACGMDMQNVRFLWASDEINKDPNGYWLKVMDIARNFTISRMKRCSSIMGRTEGDDQASSQILYPCMQCADIFYLKADICQLGRDQLKVNMLARDYAKAKKMRPHEIPIILSHELIPGLLKGQEKMSKTDPDSAIFMEDTEPDVKRKIKQAFCPPQEVEGNPVIAYAETMIVPSFGSMAIPTKKGLITITCGKELRRKYSSGEIHPGDLKPAVADYLNKLIEPVRKHFETDEHAKKLLKDIKAYKH